MDVCLAVDVGATKLAVGIVTDQGDLVSSRHVPTAQTDSPETLFDALKELVEEVAAEVF